MALVSYSVPSSKLTHDLPCMMYAGSDGSAGEFSTSPKGVLFRCSNCQLIRRNVVLVVQDSLDCAWRMDITVQYGSYGPGSATRDLDRAKCECSDV